MKKIPLGIAIGLMAVTAGVTFLVTGQYTLNMFNEKIRNVNEKQEIYGKLSEIDSYVRSSYISDIDSKSISSGIVSGYIGGIGDRYAQYLTAEQYNKRQSLYSGIRQGLGFDFEKDSSGYALITAVHEFSNAEEAGLVKGDIITAVNNRDILSYSGGYDSAAAFFSSPEGTRVRLNVKRKNDEGKTEFITYDVVSQSTEYVSVTGRMISNLAYIRITEFNDNTAAQLKSTVDALIGEGAEGLILDVRNTWAGKIENVSACINVFAGAGEFVFATNTDGSEKPVVICTDDTKTELPLSVIMNQGTSGLAELFPLVLSESASAHTVGKATAGDGYLQSAYTCSDGSVIILSTAVLRSANGTTFVRTGIHPGYDVGIADEIDYTKLTDEAALISDSQLMKAIEITMPQSTEPADESQTEE